MITATALTELRWCQGSMAEFMEGVTADMVELIWQDIALMIGGFIFAPALIASILKKANLPVATTLPTALVLTMFVICYITLGLYLAAISTALTAACWYVLCFRR